MRPRSQKMPLHGVPASGLVDAHIHIRDVKGLETVAAAGVVAVRDAGLRRNTEQSAVDLRGRIDRPVVISSRWAIYKKGGYGSLFGLPVETTNEIRSEIHALKRAGAGIIKVIASGIVSFKDPGTVTPGGFSCDELLFIVDEARSIGLDVMAHANGEPAIVASAEAGVRSIEHGYFMTERALERMAEKEVFWVPTIGALARAADARGISKDAQHYVESVILAHLGMVLRAHQIGVPLAIGTDCVVPDARYGEAYGAELEYLTKAGIPRDDVMKIAREGGARLLGISV
ncbi:MAG TPA: amidohydrolase family protein [Nitrospirota bacterium]|nr:amidohydrolase family protein [Nitrospirota bacterium]